MSRDRSLEEFLDGARSDGSDSEASTDAGEGANGRNDGDGPERPEAAAPPDNDEAALDPLATTYRWSADDGVCSNCGDPARARWQSDDGFVCRRCKEW